jgi:hypothetical protein
MALEILSAPPTEEGLTVKHRWCEKLHIVMVAGPPCLRRCIQESRVIKWSISISRRSTASRKLLVHEEVSRRKLVGLVDRDRVKSSCEHDQVRRFLLQKS